jgi:hypothetical protein
MTYISVPVPVWDPDPVRTSPLGGAGRVHRSGTAQRYGQAEPATPSLVQRSIRDPSAIKKPHEIVWESYKNASLLTKQKYGNLIVNFCRYMDMCETSGFSATGIAPITNDNGLRKISGPLCNRWHPLRRTGWIAKMHHVSEWYEANRINGCTLITLTGFQEQSGLSWYDTLDNITKARRNLLKVLRKYFGKISYFWVIEPHTENNTGYPHIHLAVFTIVDNEVKDSYGEGMEDKLRRLYSEEWEVGSHTYGLDFKPMKGEDEIVNLKNYLMKYISKGYVSDTVWSDGELIFNAHLYGATHGDRPPQPGEQLNAKGEFAKKYRLVGMSQDLSAILKPELDEDKETIVWLHTDETEPAEVKDDKGNVIETTQTVKVLFDRQFIPDYIGLVDHKTKYQEIQDTIYRYYLWLGCNFDMLGYTPFEIGDEIEETWGRPLAKIQSWESRVYDEKAARRARKIQQDGYL